MKTLEEKIREYEMGKDYSNDKDLPEILNAKKRMKSLVPVVARACPTYKECFKDIKYCHFGCTKLQQNMRKWNKKSKSTKK